MSPMSLFHFPSNERHSIVTNCILYEKDTENVAPTMVGPKCQYCILSKERDIQKIVGLR